MSSVIIYLPAVKTYEILQVAAPTTKTTDLSIVLIIQKMLNHAVAYLGFWKGGTMAERREREGRGAL